MKWNYINLAALLQLGFASLSTAAFDSNGVGSLEDLLQVARAAPGDGGLSQQLEGRQAGARCGPDGGGASCSGNLCCSAFGYCGEGDSYCPQLVGCQPNYGWCEGEPLPSPTSTAVSTTAVPTSTSTTLVPTSTPITTTSRTSTSEVSSAPSSTATSPVTGPLVISQNGMCGNGTTCAGSRFGRCCSQFYYCGNDDSFCGGGCQPQFGGCGVPGQATTVTVTSVITSSTTVTVGGGTGSTITVTRTVTSVVSSVLTTTAISTTSLTPTTTSSVITTTSSAVSTPSATVPAGMRSSTDGTCGNGVTCIGSGGGQCCSQWGYCGDDRQHCVTTLGCQPEFGICTSD